MKLRYLIGLVVLLALITSVCFKWKRDEPRRHSLACLDNLRISIETDSPGLLDTVVIPQTLTARTRAEQIEFLSKALREEISTDGISALRRRAKFGKLDAIFPTEALRWADQAGVNASNCLAFRMDRNGVEAEVVIYRQGEDYRVLRCNNVKQMAGGN